MLICAAGSYANTTRRVDYDPTDLPVKLLSFSCNDLLVLFLPTMHTHAVVYRLVHFGESSSGYRTLEELAKQRSKCDLAIEVRSLTPVNPNLFKKYYC